MHYQPVTVTMWGGGPNDAPGHEEHNATVFSYRDGAIVRFDLELHNPAKVDATITGLDDGPLLGVLKFAGLRVWEKYPQGCCLESGATPTRVSAPGAGGSSRPGLHLSLRMTNCEYYGNDDPFAAGGGGGDSVGYTELRFPMRLQALTTW